MNEKFFNIRKWLSVADTAARLSLTFGEKITEADIYRLALDGDLKISVDIYHPTYAKKGFIVDPQDAHYEEVPDPMGGQPIKVGGPIFTTKNGELKVIDIETSDSNCSQIKGLFDLLMVGGEKNIITELYQKEAFDEDVAFYSLDGSFVTDENYVYSLQERKWNNQKKKAYFYPTDGIPKYANLVVRRDEIVRFENDIKFEENKPVSTKERNTLLAIIATLCQEAKIDHTRPAKAAASIQHAADSIGISIGESTIESHLKKIPEALASRMK